MNPDRPPLDNSSKDSFSDKTPLSENDFIQNKPVLASLPFWVWIFLVASFAAIIIGSRGWYEGFLEKEKSNEPFLEVTNREFSVFLWQFPSYIRKNVSKKTGYLPGFFMDRENINLQNVEDYVSAPPDLIFLYHTWSRQLSHDLIIRSISPEEFSEFLEKLPEWQPENWKHAPEEYRTLINTKSYLQVANLQSLDQSTLPLMVRQAFRGWKNYFKEGPEINAFQPTIGQTVQFLEQHPTYARNYWRNIKEVADQPVAGTNYLSLLMVGNPPSSEKFPEDQLSAFLKAAMYNAEHD